MSGEMKVRVYPSGMLEVLGGDPDEVALVAATVVAKGFLTPMAKPSADPELPFINGSANGAHVSPAVKSASRPAADRSPFYDASVTRNHPAILRLEHLILAAPNGRQFEYHWMREFVGKEITGVARECMTKAVGTLMARLEQDGIVQSHKRGHWEKVAKIAK